MTNSAIKYRKKPVVIEAMRWTGNNKDDLVNWAGAHFDTVDPEDATDDPRITAEVFDVLHSTWVGVRTGDYIIKGITGEFYPCNGEVFDGTYEVYQPPKPGPTVKRAKQPQIKGGAITLDTLHNRD